MVADWFEQSTCSTRIIGLSLLPEMVIVYRGS